MSAFEPYGLYGCPRLSAHGRPHTESLIDFLLPSWLGIPFSRSRVANVVKTRLLAVLVVLGGEPEPEPSNCVMPARSSGAQGYLSVLWQHLSEGCPKVKSGAGVFFLRR